MRRSVPPYGLNKKGRSGTPGFRQRPDILRWFTEQVCSKIYFRSVLTLSYLDTQTTKCFMSGLLRRK